MPPQTDATALHGPLGHIIETTRNAHAALGMPGVSWAADYAQLETLMRRHPAYAEYLLRLIARTASGGGTYGGWVIVGHPTPP